MKLDRRTIIVGAAASSVAALGGRRAFAADPIRIGAILPLSGTAEIVGTKQRLGIEIATSS